MNLSKVTTMLSVLIVLAGGAILYISILSVNKASVLIEESKNQITAINKTFNKDMENAKEK